jgi:glycosyltransferase involved in cell wall biosynthesis
MTISFIIKVRNEEITLEKSIRSLFSLTIPYEIVVILHLCTDNSENICKRLQQENDKIKIFYYHNEISKCGYENLCTDKNSPHSIVTYYNWCLEKAMFDWKFKWDADFIASNELIYFLNNNDWENKKNIKYKISAINSDSKNSEFYLSDSILYYSKHVFWEVPVYLISEEIILDDSIFIVHDSELIHCKTYWRKPPWFLTEHVDEIEGDIKEKYFKLIHDFGHEPIGMARASNPEGDLLYFNITQQKPNYINLYD